MKFLKINAKVLLILCLFSGILFLSTACSDKETSNDDNNIPNEKQEDKPSDNTNGNNSIANNPDKADVSESEDNSKNNKVDYSVWVANTTINTDKNQRSYKVIWGDTLWLISTVWEVPYQEIARYNNIPNPDLIYVDQIIYNPLFK